MSAAQRSVRDVPTAPHSKFCKTRRRAVQRGSVARVPCLTAASRAHVHGVHESHHAMRTRHKRPRRVVTIVPPRDRCLRTRRARSVRPSTRAAASTHRAAAAVAGVSGRGWAPRGMRRTRTAPRPASEIPQFAARPNATPTAAAYLAGARFLAQPRDRARLREAPRQAVSARCHPLNGSKPAAVVAAARVRPSPTVQPCSSPQQPFPPYTAPPASVASSERLWPAGRDAYHESTVR